MESAKKAPRITDAPISRSRQLCLAAAIALVLGLLGAMVSAEPLVVQDNLNGQIGKTAPVKIGASSSSALELGGLDFEFWFQSNQDYLRSADVRIQNDSINLLTPESGVWSDGAGLPKDDKGRFCNGQILGPTHDHSHWAGPGIHSVAGEKILISAYGNSDVIRGSISLSFTSNGQWHHQHQSSGPAFLLYPTCMESHSDNSEWVNPAADPATYGDITEICRHIGVSFTDSIEIGGYYYVYFSMSSQHGSLKAPAIQLMRVAVNSSPPYVKFGEGHAQLFHKGRGVWYNLPFDPEFGYYLNICGQPVCTSTQGASMANSVWCQEPISYSSVASWSVTGMRNLGKIGGISLLDDGKLMLTHTVQVRCPSGLTTQECRRVNGKLAFWQSFDPTFSDTSLQYLDTSHWLEDSGSTTCPPDDSDTAWYVNMAAAQWWVHDLPGSNPDMIAFTSYHDARCSPWTRGKIRASYLGPEASGNPPSEICVSLDGDQVQDGAVWDFGETPPGVQTAEYSVLKNCGTNPLIIDAATLSGTNAPNFSISSDFLGQLPWSLQPGEQTNMWVAMIGNAEGPRNATLRISSNDLDEPDFDLSLSGYIGSQSDADLCVAVEGTSVTSGGTWNFGSTPSGVQTAEPATLTNCGTTDLMIDAATLSGTNAANFSISSGFLSQLPLTLGPGQNTSMWVAMIGNAEGPRNATLRISSNDLDEPDFDLSLSGYIGSQSSADLCVAVDGASVAPGGTWNFGSTPSGVQTAEPATLTNCGTTDLIIDAATLSGTNAANFSISSGFLSQLPLTLGPGQNTIMWVLMIGNAVGPRTANLSLSSSDSNDPNFALTLAGYIESASSPELCVYLDGSVLLEGSTWNIGTAPSGGGTSDTAVLRNCGDASLNIQQPSITGANRFNFYVASPSSWPQQLAPGQQVSLTIAMTGSAIGPRNATLTLNSDDPANPQYLLALTGHIQ